MSQYLAHIFILIYAGLKKEQYKYKLIFNLLFYNKRPYDSIETQYK